MKLLKLGISGVRGIVGDALTPSLAMDFAGAFSTLLSGRKILVGRDTRLSSPMITAAVRAALISGGSDVEDLGICPAPILQHTVKKSQSAGGISVSAGHNGKDWNALTFINGEGTTLNEYQGAELLDIYHMERFRKVPFNRLGTWNTNQNYVDGYFKHLTSFLNRKAVAEKKYKIVIDPCNGAGALFINHFSRWLGCELIPINNTPSGHFPHDPEPRPRNASEVSSILRITKADAGFLLNSDVSRVSLVSEDGETLSEEYTLPLAADYYLEKHPGPVVTNHSTSSMISEVASRFGCPLLKAKVGQSYGIQAMLDEDAVMAGEGSGSLAIGAFFPAFDGFLTMGIILEAMAVQGKKLSELVRRLPRCHIIKDKIYCPTAKVHSIVNEIKRFFPRNKINTEDGLKVYKSDGWFHIRASATEPMIRIIAESRTEAKAAAYLEKAAHIIREMI